MSLGEMPEDFALLHRGPAITVCPSRALRMWKRYRVVAVYVLIASPALYMAGRYAIQWAWGL